MHIFLAALLLFGLLASALIVAGLWLHRRPSAWRGLAAGLALGLVAGALLDVTLDNPSGPGVVVGRIVLQWLMGGAGAWLGAYWRRTLL